MDPHPAGRAADQDLSGRSLGGYRLIRRLGSGAMGDVYLAEQTSLGRQVAVKVLRGEATRRPEAVGRFEQEARAAAALVHGNIVQIHEVACVDGIHYLAEEYVAGPSLKAWLAARGPLDARQAVCILTQVGSALARSAEQGIVHRDIKPENLLLTPAGEVKVADFGLARVLSENLDLTQDGMTLGTPLYMSPEQGEGSAVDSRSDLYSLGATVYHLLTGRPPYVGPSAVAVVMAHIKEPLVALASVRPDLPAGLCAIVDRLLAKNPGQRFQSPQDLLHALHPIEHDTALSRTMPSPLAWAEGDAWHDGGSARVLSAPWASSPGALAGAATAARVTSDRLRDATVHLRVAAIREEANRELTRRTWVVTAIASLAALAVGFGFGRTRQRRSQLFGGRR
ncbi:MAG: serine/threonine protein kinase [Planctomycetia bacterium]|nr:serine/threonine protein kinase [Planctomycetia bacterium]